MGRPTGASMPPRQSLCPGGSTASAAVTAARSCSPKKCPFLTQPGSAGQLTASCDTAPLYKCWAATRHHRMRKQRCAYCSMHECVMHAGKHTQMSRRETASFYLQQGSVRGAAKERRKDKYVCSSRLGLIRWKRGHQTHASSMAQHSMTCDAAKGAAAPLLADEGQHVAVRLEAELAEHLDQQVGRQRQNSRLGRVPRRARLQPQRQRLPLARPPRAPRAALLGVLAQPDVAPDERQRRLCARIGVQSPSPASRLGWASRTVWVRNHPRLWLFSLCWRWQQPLSFVSLFPA